MASFPCEIDFPTVRKLNDPTLIRRSWDNGRSRRWRYCLNLRPLKCLHILPPDSDQPADAETLQFPVADQITDVVDRATPALGQGCGGVRARRFSYWHLPIKPAFLAAAVITAANF